jgi:hypothetical protein
MAKFFNTTRGPLNATVDGAVLMFPSKAWTEVDDAVGTSASLQSLVKQGLLIFRASTSTLKPATASKPRPAKGAAPAPAPKKAAPSAKPAAPKSKVDLKDVPKADAPKTEPPKTTTDPAAPATTSKI